MVFLIGSIGAGLDEEIILHGDILRLNFTESHYLLPIKDIAYIHYIEEHCPQADFVFKGDDDILVIPENVKYMIREMQTDGTHAIGHVIRILNDRELQFTVYILAQNFIGQIFLQ